MLADDLSVLFDDPFWSVEITRSRLLADDVTFRGIVGDSDDDALDGRALAARRTLAYATGPDLVDGDTLTVTGSGALARYSGTYRAREPRPVNDGLESRCGLVLITAG